VNKATLDAAQDWHS